MIAADITAADMTANRGTLAVNNPVRSFDPVRTRVHCESLMTNAERMQAEAAQRAAAEQRKSRAPLGIATLADTRFGRYVSNLHPGDIFYWVACLGGACLLLLKATI
jgi:hypothetical protein